MAATTPYVALFRGINVGKAKRVAMADLRRMIEGLGYTGVRTLLNSGNAVFFGPAGRAADASARIEQGLAKACGVVSRVLVLDGPALRTILAENPYGEVPDPPKLLVLVLFDAGDVKKLEPLRNRDWSPQRLEVGSRAAYLWCPQGISAGPLADEAMKALAQAATGRNWATLRKLEAMLKTEPGG